MLVKISPSYISGTVSVPASKSMAHRLLICAGLSQGESIIENVSYSEDILATLDCLEKMGSLIEKGEDFVRIKGSSPFEKGNAEYMCRESGSTLRFFIPIAFLGKGKSVFYGCGRLMERPLSVYEKIAEEKNLYFNKTDSSVTVGGLLTSGFFSLQADVSSQFISGLLFVLPLCEGDSEIELTGKVESRSYINMTMDAMKSFGVSAFWKNENTICIKGGQSYTSGRFTVEGDYSNGAFLDAFNYIGGNVVTEGYGETTLQGDSVYKKYFKLLEEESPILDISDCPDLAPIIMTLAAELNGVLLKGTRRLKIKESDRGFVMKQELLKFGANIEIYDDSVLVKKTQLRKPVEKLVSHNDHRVVMSLSVLCSKYGGEIENAQAVNKSFPDFFDKVRSIGMKVIEYDDK